MISGTGRGSALQWAIQQESVRNCWPNCWRSRSLMARAAVAVFGDRRVLTEGRECPGSGLTSLSPISPEQAAPGRAGLHRPEAS